MNEFSLVKADVDNRVDIAINESIKTYMNKLSYGMFFDGLEISFQCYLFDILQSELEKVKIHNDEYFTVIPEFNIPLASRNDEIDIAINYACKNLQKKWLIELKYKKKTQSAMDLSVVQSLADIKDLEGHLDATNNIHYFFFLTDWDTYVKSNHKGALHDLPMYDGAILEANKTYFSSGKTVKEEMRKQHYPNGFVFNNTYTIDYHHVTSNHGKEYWYFALKIKG